MDEGLGHLEQQLDAWCGLQLDGTASEHRGGLHDLRGPQDLLQRSGPQHAMRPPPPSGCEGLRRRLLQLEVVAGIQQSGLPQGLPLLGHGSNNNIIH